MKIGVSIPNNWGVLDPRRLVDLAVRAEHAGFASVWTSEHLINIAYVRDRIGDRPYHHPLSILSAIAARTHRVALGTSVLVLPFHNPFDLAKYVATLDQLSHGRAILGVGVGNVREEFDALGIDWTQRGALTDETIAILRALWAPGAASHAGRHWSFEDVHSVPKPFDGRRLPIWVGGMSDAALRRAVAAQGWHPTAISPKTLADQLGRMRAIATDRGSQPENYEICMRFNIALDDMVVTAAELQSTLPGFDGVRALQIAQDYAAAGVTHFIFALNGHDPAILEDTVDRLAGAVLPAFDRIP